MLGHQVLAANLFEVWIQWDVKPLNGWFVQDSMWTWEWHVYRSWRWLCLRGVGASFFFTFFLTQSVSWWGWMESLFVMKGPIVVCPPQNVALYLGKSVVCPCAPRWPRLKRVGVVDMVCVLMRCVPPIRSAHSGSHNKQFFRWDLWLCFSSSWSRREKDNEASDRSRWVI